MNDHQFQTDEQSPQKEKHEAKERFGIQTFSNTNNNPQTIPELLSYKQSERVKIRTKAEHFKGKES